MSINVRTVRPGYIIGLKTEITGNVTYQRVDLSPNDDDDDAGDDASESTLEMTSEGDAPEVKVTRWKTTKIVENPDELERATKVRGMARSLIERLCFKTTLGLMCKLEQKPALDAAEDKAQELVREFNRTATITRIWFGVVPSVIESDSERATANIMREAGRLIVEMDAGIKEFDPEKIKKAAAKARQLSGMLGDEQQSKLNSAVDQARKASRTIVKRIETEGEDRAIVMMDIQRGQIESARIAFLDMSGESNAVEALPATDAQRFADLDMGGEQVVMPESITAPAIEMDR
jgi:hypothetical protein